MATVVQYEHDHFDTELFFSSHWRRVPVLVRGGATEFLGRTWGSADFQAACARARAAGHPVMECVGEVTFVERVSMFDGDLAARAARLSRTFGSPQPWFDGIRTYTASGIGAHFDHSDNFVLQQEGVKEWSLASPRHLDRSDIARRMMGEPIGARPLPETDLLTFVLEPGDLLYLPLFWLHTGVSRGPSLSVSFVCPAVSLYSAVVPLLTRVMKNRAIGNQPVPAFHAGLSGDERRAVAAALRKATRTLLDRVADDELVDAVHDLQLQMLVDFVN
jgi:50S ribosomal protein L16 3-hydroxylase